jgi:hypothetical protein
MSPVAAVKRAEENMHGQYQIGEFKTPEDSTKRQEQAA